MLNLVRRHQAIRPQLLSALEQVMRDGQYILGARVHELEQRVAEYVGAGAAVGCASGTDALHLSLRALEIGAGAAVVTTAYSFFATAEAISLTGAMPLFVDIELDTYNLDPFCLEEFCTKECALTDGTLIHCASELPVKAIVPVHLFGQCAAMPEILKTARSYDLPVIEDAAQSLGAGWQDADGIEQKAGATGDIGCFSFYPTKNLGALGDGGMMVTSDDELAERLRMLRAHGARLKNEHELIGLNSRLDEVQAALLLVLMDSFDEMNQRRQAHFQFYNERLDRYVTTPVVRPHNRSVYHQYIIRTEQRDALKTFLSECGIETEVYYPTPLHLQPCYRTAGAMRLPNAPSYELGDFPNAEQAARETLALPIDPLLADEERAYVAESIIQFFSR